MKIPSKTYIAALAAVMALAFVTGLMAQADKAKKEETKKKEGYDSRDPKYKYDPKEVQAARDKYGEDTRPDESLLSKFIGKEIVDKLQKGNLEKLHMLRIILSNFGKDDWTKEYKTLYDNYKGAIRLLNKRDFIYSRVELEKNYKEINDLYKKISDAYREDTSKMLDICAESVLILSRSEKTQSDPEMTRKVYDNLGRIRIAYGQMDESMVMYIDHNYQQSLLHLRNAKSYAIRIMEDLLDKTKLDDYKNFYRKDDFDAFSKLLSEKETFKLPVHKADNLNRIYEDKSK